MTQQSALANADALFHALGDPTRRAILGRLARQPASVSELAQALDITKTAVGQHMAVLESCALAKSSKTGRVRTCEFEPRGLQTVQEWIDFHRDVWSNRLDRLGEILSGN